MDEVLLLQQSKVLCKGFSTDNFDANYAAYGVASHQLKRHAEAPYGSQWGKLYIVASNKLHLRIIISTLGYITTASM